MIQDGDLLALEAATLWEMEGARRIRPRDGGRGPHVAMAVAGDGSRRVWFGETVPESVAREILPLASASQTPPSIQPPQLIECRASLTRHLGPLAITGGPSYLVPPRVDFDAPHRVVLSTGSTPAEARSPASGWRQDEWDDLMAGRLGPWAMAVAGGRVVSLCHCSRLTEAGAEAGVWTDADHRGRGLAASVTAAWAGLLAPSGRLVFYSTAKENRSSQRVAARLRLRNIGWIWQIAAAPARN